MSTSAPLYSYTGRESRANKPEDGDLDDIIEQIKMACRPVEQGQKEVTDSDYDTDIDDQGKCSDDCLQQLFAAIRCYHCVNSNTIPVQQHAQ